MLPLDVPALHASLVNASRKEASDLTPPDLDGLDWDRLDLLGWRDPRQPRRAYAVVPFPGDGDVGVEGSGDGGVGVVRGVLLRPADAVPRRRAQCAWCQDVMLPNDVVFYSARLAGPAGRRGATVGTLLCRDFECSHNVRVLPPLAYQGFDRDAARTERIRVLRERSRSFVETVLSGATEG